MDTSTSKPRRIKALLSSFLKGVSREEKSECDSKQHEGNAKLDSSKEISLGSEKDDVQEGLVVVDEWPPKSSDQRSSFQPQNRESFFKRVETFSTSTWFAKPEGVSPLRCAQYGWENIHTDSLKCVSCKEVVYGGLPPKWEREAYEKESARLQESLKTGHSKICPWPSNCSPACFSEVQLLNHSEVEEAFLKRVSSIRCLGTGIPAVDRTTLYHVPEEAAEISYSMSRLVMEVLGEEPTSDYKDRIEVVCYMALCGWSRSSPEESKNPILTCEYCRRNVGVWNFTPFEKRSPASPTAVDTEEPAAKRLKVDKGPFNPVEEHRTWCPWTKPASSPTVVQPLALPAGPVGPEGETATKRPAWQELLALLHTKSSPDRHKNDSLLTNKNITPPSQAWKVVRRITNFWQSRGAAQKT